ncbi:MAG: DUF2780 domain-containing protein [Actinomycetota bacterium]
MSSAGAEAPARGHQEYARRTKTREGHMDELISQIVEKTGVTAQQAKEGVTIALDWVKDKLPSDVVDQLSGVLEGAGDMAADAVEKAKGAAGSASDAAGGAASSATDVAGNLWEKAKDLLPGGE